MTKLFEYPSETSFLEEGDEAVLTIKATHDVRDTSSQNSAANSKGMFQVFVGSFAAKQKYLCSKNSYFCYLRCMTK
jgi:hypothetical protein